MFYHHGCVKYLSGEKKEGGGAGLSTGDALKGGMCDINSRFKAVIVKRADLLHVNLL